MIKANLIILFFLPIFVQAQCDSLKPYQIPPLTTVYEIWPEYSGGDKALTEYLRENLILPSNWPNDSINGIVYVSFLVDKQGKIKFPCLLRGIDPILDSIALESIHKMPKWIPAMQRGKPLECVYTLPIHFGMKKKIKR